MPWRKLVKFWWLTSSGTTSLSSLRHPHLEKLWHAGWPMIQVFNSSPSPSCPPPPPSVTLLLPPSFSLSLLTNFLFFVLKFLFIIYIGAPMAGSMSLVYSIFDSTSWTSPVPVAPSTTNPDDMPFVTKFGTGFAAVCFFLFLFSIPLYQLSHFSYWILWGEEWGVKDLPK